MRRAHCLTALALLLAPLGACATDSPGAEQPGKIIAAAPVDQPGQNTGAGAIAGMVVGGVVGAQFGAGVGQALAAAGGVIAGSYAGSAAETAAQSHTGMAYTIQLDNGEVVTLAQHLDSSHPALAVGTPVILQTNGEAQQVLPRG
jgi:outer membrane lipoprotein SlyB